MKNKTLLAIPIILLALYNVFVFSLFGADGPKFWPTYIFTTLALLMGTGLIWFYVSNKNLTRRDTFLNWPMVYVSCGYALVQTILSFAVLSADNFSPTAANLTQAVLLALHAILAVSTVFGRNASDEIDRKQAETTFFIRDLTSDAERLAARVKDSRARNKILELYETARYSDPMSHETLMPVEREIREKFGELSSFASSEKEIPSLREEIEILCEEITLLLGERNSKCKLLK
ncbi:MAG: hypothetical protein LBL73_09520 [Synergistaceae bacterium]|jgi:hypothetical protein|nr:hypothetical protein [Synergistaceae bacterium]